MPWLLAIKPNGDTALYLKPSFFFSAISQRRFLRKTRQTPRIIQVQKKRKKKKYPPKKNKQDILKNSQIFPTNKHKFFLLLSFLIFFFFDPICDMHQKKSEAQIGKESSGVSSDFNPAPPLLYHSTHHHPPSSPTISVKTHNQYHHNIQFPQYPSQGLAPNDLLPIPTTPYKRPLLTQTHSSLSKSPTLYKFPPPHQNPPCFSRSFAAKTGAFRLLRRLNRLRRLVILLSLPFFYFLVSHPSHSFLLDFLSAFAFSAALLFSLNLALPRLPSIRLFLARSIPIKLISPSSLSRPPLPVFWSIGSRPKSEKRLNSGCWVQAFSNGDMYEGEFHKGKCSGSGVYYYYMSGRYEGDWVDGKYDGYGVETWARGSRYRGHYRQGLRHGFGVYRFYTGDVYAGEWSNGQSHGCGVHTCEDGSRYVGEFKWGVKHGLGHYHFR